MAEIKNVLDSTPIIIEPNCPFPQADKFDRVVDLLGLLTREDQITKDFITGNYSFNARQTDYYGNAGRYLGLIERTGDGCKLSGAGIDIMRASYKSKYLSLVGSILSHEVFSKALKRHFEKLSPLNKHEVIEIMKNSHINNVDSETTIARRAITVIKRIDWILELD